MIRTLLKVALAGLAALPTAIAAQQPAPTAAPSPTPRGVIGTWINPHGTVKVETGDCGKNLCGWVVWATQQAQADARDGGAAKLVGTELLRDYHVAGQGRYEGQVYVPDMGRSFYSTIRVVGADDLRISGCILGGLICKTQDWRRA